MTPQDQWLLQKEKVLAWLRAGFAVVAILLIQLNPSRIARFPLLSYVSLGFFLIYSLAILYLTLQERPIAKKIGLPATCLDLVWVSLIVFSTGGAATPFFVYYFFPVITASSRYGIKGGVSAGLVGVALYGYIRFNSDWEDLLGIDRFIVRSIYLVVLAYVFGFLSEFEKKQNQKLLALSVTAGEVATLEERRRIAQELHDGLLQSLATHILRLETCRKHLLDSPKELEPELRTIEDDTRGAMQEIRKFLAGKETRPFPPGMLLDKLKEDLRFLQDGLGIKVILQAESDESSVPDGVERTLYYVFREGLMNVMRHSHASRLDVALKQKGTAIEGALSDDGVGFDPALAANGHGMGLKGMTERIKNLGGELTIESSPGKGSRLAFVVPNTAKDNINLSHGTEAL